MSKNNKKRGCSGTIFLLLAVFFVSTLFVDLDASDFANGNYSTARDTSSFSVTFSTLPNHSETTDVSLSSVNFNTTTSSPNTTQGTTVNNFIQKADSDIRFTDADRLYNQLDADQKEIYNELLEGSTEGELNYKFTDINYKDFQHAYYAFLFEHPEFFWLELNPDMSMDFSGNLNVKLKTYSYWTYSNDRDGYIDRFNKKVEEILQGAAHCVTDYEKVKYVHDYLVTNIVYDMDTYAELEKSMKSTDTEIALSLYGALVNGRCVCGGYSESFYYLTRALGVNSFYIQGYVGEEYHAWNYLELDGEYYYMDVTWDDYNNPDYPKGIMYSYFCVTDDELFADHDPDDDYPAPECSGEKYNYHRYNGYYFTEYDFEAVRKALNDQQGQQFASIRFSDNKAYRKALNDLMDNSNIYNIELIKNMSNESKYYEGEDTNVLTICIK